MKWQMIAAMLLLAGALGGCNATMDDHSTSRDPWVMPEGFHEERRLRKMLSFADEAPRIEQQVSAAE